MLDITSELIFDKLSESYQAKFYGQMRKFPLKAPKLLSANKELKNRHIYVTLADHFPVLSVDTNHSLDLLVICVGHLSRRPYVRDNLQVIVVENGSIWDVFDDVSDLYERYSQWSRELEALAQANGSPADMIRITLPILENSIAILSKNLYHIAIAYWSADPETGKDIWNIQENEMPLPAERVSSLQKILPLTTKKNDPYSAYEGAYSINLIRNGWYEGVVSLVAVKRRNQQSDYHVFQYFVSQISRVLLSKKPLALIQTDSFKRVISDLLHRNPVSSHRLARISEESVCETHQYKCFKIKRTKNSENLSVDFVCNSLEPLLSGCAAVEYEGSVVMILDKLSSEYNYDDNLHAFTLWLDSFGFRAGVSEEFENIQDVYHYFRQACCALELGIEYGFEQIIYQFRKYAPLYMMIQSTGEFFVEHMIPPGLRKLIRYSEETGIDYWGTLRTYLDNMQNATKTAKELYLARSSLLARIERIESMIQMDLSDLMSVIRLRTIMYLLEMKHLSPVSEP